MATVLARSASQLDATLGFRAMELANRTCDAQSKYSWAMMKLGLVILSAGLLLGACDNVEVESEEVARVMSPDGSVEAVLSEGSIDATTAIVHRLHLVGAGGSTVGQEPLLVGDHFRNLEVVWRADRFLDLHYSEGRIFEFQNFWQSSEIDNWAYVVEIRLNPPADGVSLGIAQ